MVPQQTGVNRDDTSLVRGSIAAVRLGGVPVRLHFTFVLLFVFLVFSEIGERSGVVNALYIAALFGSVLLHELGHAVVARRYGVRTLEIIMFPIGGLARMDRQPKAAEEFWIAIAGPAVNLVIAAGLFAWLVWNGSLQGLGKMAEPTDANNVLERIATGNLVLAAFNLLPAFPMDGGRILRSLLALKRPEDQATRLAARTGQFLAIAMGLFGLLAGNFMLVFVAFFVYLGAAQEGAAAVGRILTHGTPVRAAMVTDFRTLSHGSTIRDAANMLLATTQQDFPVMHGDQVLGLLGRSALVRAMASQGQDAYVASAMDRDFVRVLPDQDLAEALPILAKAGSCVLVMQGDELLGLLTAENVTEFLLLRQVGMQPAVSLEQKEKTVV